MEYNDTLYYGDTEDDDIENGAVDDLNDVGDETDSKDDVLPEEVKDQGESGDDLNDVGDETDSKGKVSSEEVKDQGESGDDPNDLGAALKNMGEVSPEEVKDQEESGDDLNDVGDETDSKDDVSPEEVKDQGELGDDLNDVGDETVNKDDVSPEEVKDQGESGDDPNDLGDETENEDDEYEDDYFNKKDWFEGQLISVEDRINLANRNLDVLEWENENRIGDCVMKPKDANSEIAKALTEAGVEGIKYTNGNVDFSPVSKYDFEIENMEELYKKLGDSISIGKLDSRKDLSREVRSKWQSLVKDEIVSRVNSDSNFAEQFEKKTGIKAPFGEFTKKMLNDGLSQNKLSLHETSDCSSVQFVPRTIHETYKHCGGTAEMMEKLLSGDHKA